VKGVSMATAEAAIDEEVKKLQAQGVTDKELEKVKNKTESMMAFEDMSVMNRATSIAMYEQLGDADLINKELEMYQAVTTEQIATECSVIFDENNSNTLYYFAN